MLVSAPALSQAPAAAVGAATSPDAAQMDYLVGPIALYPDDLVAIILPASTSPLQIVQADRYLDKRKTDPKLKIDDKWDDPVKSLLNYPDVVKKMSNDLDWTSALGEAVVADQGAVIDGVQSFRRRAQFAGNLKSDGKQVVKAEKEIIIIESANPEVIYVPQYTPSTVVTVGVAPIYGYYPTPYPSYYYPYAPGAAMAAGVIWGAAIGAAWSGNHYGYGGGNNTINVNRNTNINTGNINTGNVNRGGRAGAQGGGSAWKSNKQPGQVSDSVGKSAPSARAGDARGGAGAAGGGDRPSAQPSGMGGGRRRWRSGRRITPIGSALWHGWQRWRQQRQSGRVIRWQCLRRCRLIGTANADGQFAWRAKPQFGALRDTARPPAEAAVAGGDVVDGRSLVMNPSYSIQSKTSAMNIFHLWSFLRRLALTLLVIAPLAATAAPQQTFATPQEAVEALMTALVADGDSAMISIFGEEHKELFTSNDRAASSATRAKVLAAMQLLRVLHEPSPDRRVLVIGDEAWPVPIPIVRTGDRWRFATELGEDELINRFVGGNERNAIYVARAYIDAQRAYASRDRDGDGVLQYAQKLASAAGKQDGLYWTADEAKGEEASPFGPLIAESALTSRATQRATPTAAITSRS